LNRNIIRIDRVSISDQVAKQLQSLITSGEFKVGDKLPTENELCAQFGVGRSTVREALRVLVAMGMVRILPGKGAFVAKNEDNSFDAIKYWFTEKHAELSELIEVRMAIEPLAIRLAIQRASDESIRQIQEIHSAFKAAALKQDHIELAILDESFHNAIIYASGNSLLIKIGKLIADAMKEFRARSFAVHENISHATIPHERIVEAILKKDEKAGVEAMMNHLALSKEDMEKVVNV
jgi:GntR family transcriptional repressor for pyruvate dehydrogenase complex